MTTTRYRVRRAGQWIQQHPGRVLMWIAVLLLIVIILQNVEPTSIDVLFWTLVAVPKLVLLLGAMLLGALLWEGIRRRLVARSRAPRRRRHDRY